MLYDELQCFIISRRQLLDQVFELEEDPVELYADLVRLHGARVEAQRLQLLHDDALTFLCQTDDVVIVTEQEEGLWELQVMKEYKIIRRK